MGSPHSQVLCAQAETTGQLGDTEIENTEGDHCRTELSQTPRARPWQPLTRLAWTPTPTPAPRLWGHAAQHGDGTGTGPAPLGPRGLGTARGSLHRSSRTTYGSSPPAPHGHGAPEATLGRPLPPGKPQTKAKNNQKKGLQL